MSYRNQADQKQECLYHPATTSALSRDRGGLYFPCSVSKLQLAKGSAVRLVHSALGFSPPLRRSSLRSFPSLAIERLQARRSPPRVESWIGRSLVTTRPYPAFAATPDNRELCYPARER